MLLVIPGLFQFARGPGVFACPKYVPPTDVTSGWLAGSDTARFRFWTTSPPLVVRHPDVAPGGSLTNWPILSAPFSSETMELMGYVDVLIVAMTSPGKPRPLSTARISWLSGDMPMDWTRPVPLPVRLVEMVVTTAWVVKLTTVTPPPIPALAT